MASFHSKASRLKTNPELLTDTLRSVEGDIGFCIPLEQMKGKSFLWLEYLSISSNQSIAQKKLLKTLFAYLNDYYPKLKIGWIGTLTQDYHLMHTFLSIANYCYPLDSDYERLLDLHGGKGELLNYLKRNIDVVRYAHRTCRPNRTKTELEKILSYQNGICKSLQLDYSVTRPAESPNCQPLKYSLESKGFDKTEGDQLLLIAEL